MLRVVVTLVVWAITCEGVAPRLVAADVVPRLGQLPAESERVPQNLLRLVHAPEVQRELGINEANLDAFETLLREVDREWWPARILPPDQQRKVIAELETKLVAGMEVSLGADTIERLRQLELQSQGVRVLARPDVREILKLNSSQTKKLDTLFEETERLAVPASEPKAEAAAIEAYQKAVSGEQSKALAILSPVQVKKLPTLFGDTFETAKLERIYPLAPELIPSGHLFGDQLPTLRSLRGKVVLVHFYAYQCHNCVANFPIYKRWTAELRERGVEVIGIQTPETANERDPAKVIGSAEQEGFQFPVLIDLESENWKAWGNTMWPTVYVVDKNGYIRFWWQGELNWQGATGDRKVESLVDALLQE
jgi:peroxiredoxin